MAVKCVLPFYSSTFIVMDGLYVWTGHQSDKNTETTFVSPHHLLTSPHHHSSVQATHIFTMSHIVVSCLIDQFRETNLCTWMCEKGQTQDHFKTLVCTCTFGLQMVRRQYSTCDRNIAFKKTKPSLSQYNHFCDINNPRLPSNTSYGLQERNISRCPSYKLKYYEHQIGMFNTAL